MSIECNVVKKLTQKCCVAVRKENEQLMNSLNRAEIASDDGMPGASSEVWNSTLPGHESTPAPLDQDKKNVSHPSRGKCFDSI
jgi:hypothetical protein